MSNEKCQMCKMSDATVFDVYERKGVNVCLCCHDNRANPVSLMLCELQTQVKRLDEKVDVLLGQEMQDGVELRGEPELHCIKVERPNIPSTGIIVKDGI